MSRLRTVLRLAIVALAVLGGLTLFQDRLLYFPERATVDALARDGLAAWPATAQFRGLVAEPAGGARATAVVFHGNAGHAGHRAYYAAALLPLGLRVILAEYPGYGPREGKPGEAELVADAATTIALAHARHGPPILVIGESLGAGVAAAAAARARHEVAALLLITPWDRLESVAAHHYPWLPVSWVLNDRYDSVANLAGFRRPVMVAAAGRDDLIPPRFAAALHDTLTAPRRLVTIEGAGHNDWIERVDGGWWSAALDFLLAAAASPTGRR